MQNLLIMEVVDGKRDLRDPIEYLRLCEVLALFLHLLDLGVHVSQLAVDHDDAKVALLISEGILVRNDVDMPQLLQYLELIFNIFPLLLIDLEDLDSFECIVVVLISDVLAKKHVA